MAAFNIVRFRVRPGMEQVFLDAHRDGRAAWAGLIRGTIIATGERRYALLGEWPDMATLAHARPQMIATLDTFRHALEELDPGLGVTDAVAGEATLSLT